MWFIFERTSHLNTLNALLNVIEVDWVCNSAEKEVKTVPLPFFTCPPDVRRLDPLLHRSCHSHLQSLHSYHLSVLVNLPTCTSFPDQSLHIYSSLPLFPCQFVICVIFVFPAISLFNGTSWNWDFWFFFIKSFFVTFPPSSGLNLGLSLWTLLPC